MRTFKTIFILMIIGLTTNAQNIDLQKGLVAYYPFNGNSNDESGNGNHGYVIGATLVSDRNGNPNCAFSFNGISDYIKCDINNIPTGASPRSIFGWFKTSYPINQRIVFWGYGDEVGGQAWNISSNPVKNDRTIYFIGVNEGDIQGNSVISDGKWHCVGAVYNNNILQIYVDGVLDVQGTRYLNTSKYTFVIGRQSYPDGNRYWYANAIIDDIRIYNRPLNESEIQELYKCNLKNTTVLTNKNEIQNNKIGIGDGAFQINGIKIGSSETASKKKNTLITHKTNEISISLLKVTPDQKDNKWGLLDDKGNVVAPYIYNHIADFDKDGFACVELSGKFGLIDKKGRVVIPIIYNKPLFFSEGLANVEIDDHKFGFINKENKFVIQPDYFIAKSFMNGIAPVCQVDGKYAFIDKKGNLLTSYSYDGWKIINHMWYGRLNYGSSRYTDTQKFYKIGMDGSSREVDKNGQIISNAEKFEKGKDYPVFTVFSFTATTEFFHRMGFSPDVFEFEIIDKTERKYRIKIMKGSGKFYIHDGDSEDLETVEKGYEFWWVKWHFDDAMAKTYHPTVYLP